MPVKPLVWSEPAPPNEDVRYDHVIAATPFGRIVISWKGWKENPPDSPTIDECPWENGWGGVGNDLDDAKRISQEEFAKRVNECLEGE